MKLKGSYRFAQDDTNNAFAIQRTVTYTAICPNVLW